MTSPVITTIFSGICQAIHTPVTSTISSVCEGGGTTTSAVLQRLHGIMPATKHHRYHNDLPSGSNAGYANTTGKANTFFGIMPAATTPPVITTTFSGILPVSPISPVMATASSGMLPAETTTPVTGIPSSDMLPATSTLPVIGTSTLGITPAIPAPPVAEISSWALRQGIMRQGLTSFI